MNEYERAVIEAARTLLAAPVFDSTHLFDAVRALDDYERELAAAGVVTLEWALVVAGDEIQGQSGAWYPVLKVKQEYVMGRYTGKRIVTVQLKTGPKELIRPHSMEPFATVRRGPDGRAADEFVNVFSSGDQ